MESAKTEIVPIPHSPDFRTRYVINTKVVKVEEKFDTIHVSGFGANVVQRQESKGWFVYLQGSYEALHLGYEKPAFAHGDAVRITFEKMDNAKPQQSPV